MSINQSTSQNEQQQYVVMKYIVGKLEKYAHQSGVWRSFHASRIRKNLLHKSRHISKLHAISEDLVDECINQLFTDVDQYITQLYRLIYLQQLDELILLCSGTNRKRCVWYTLQTKRARHLFPTEEQLNDNDLLTKYYKYVREQLAPKQTMPNVNGEAHLHKDSFDLNLAYADAEAKGKGYLKSLIRKFRQQSTVDLKIIDEMLKLGECI